MSTRTVSFAELHRELRDRKGWTQQQAATRLGVAVSTVAQWEGGKKEPQSRHLRVLVREYGRPILAYLFVPTTKDKGRYLDRPFLARLLPWLTRPRPVAA